MATAAVVDGGVELAMITVEGVEVKFLLDDLATGILGVTLHAVGQARSATVGDDEEKVNIFFSEGRS